MILIRFSPVIDEVTDVLCYNGVDVLRSKGSEHIFARTVRLFDLFDPHCEQHVYLFWSMVLAWHDLCSGHNN